MDIALSILALLAGGLGLGLFAAVRAPVGYQDEKGFHYGTPTNPGPQMSRMDVRCVPRIEVASALIVDTLVKSNTPVGEKTFVREKVASAENVPLATATHA